MEEVIDGIWERIKSPFFGFLCFSFVAFNWQELFYLIFADIQVVYKLDYFNQNTGFVQLIFLPFVLAFVLTIINPCLDLAVVFFTKIPIEKTNSVKASIQSKLLEDETRLRKARATLQKQKEEEVVSEAEIDSKVSKIEDEDAREKAKTEVETIRSGGNKELVNALMTKYKKIQITYHNLLPLNQQTLSLIYANQPVGVEQAKTIASMLQVPVGTVDNIIREFVVLKLVKKENEGYSLPKDVAKALSDQF